MLSRNFEPSKSFSFVKFVKWFLEGKKGQIKTYNEILRKYMKYLKLTEDLTQSREQ